MEAITVGMGEVRVGRNNDVLQTFGIGSCVAVVLYDPACGIAGMVHAMLSAEGAATVQLAAHPLRFVERAIPSLLETLQREGAQRRRLIAFLAGGARMFATYSDPSNAIGPRNVEAARKTLRDLGIAIRQEDTGGTRGRNLLFAIATGTPTTETRQ